MEASLEKKMGEKSRARRAHHRSNHLPGMRVLSGCRLRERQLSLILHGECTGKRGKSPSEFVTVVRDG